MADTERRGGERGRMESKSVMKEGGEDGMAGIWELIRLRVAWSRGL